MLYCFVADSAVLYEEIEKTTMHGNHGNFLSLLKLLAVHDNTLRNHLQAPVMQNATYVSAQTQNELIEVMAST